MTGTAGQPDSSAASSGTPRSRSGLRELLETLIVAVLLAVVVRTFVVESYVVQGVSMLPTFLNGEHVLVNKLAFAFGAPKPGEIIVFQPPLSYVHEDYIKRVVATAGETVGVRKGQLYVDGKAVAQPYIQFWDPTSFQTVVVPKGDVFVMGDNRPDSEDSRYFGPVPIRNITGQAIFAFWPFNRLGAVGQPQPGARGYRT